MIPFFGFRALSRRASKSGCALTMRIIDSIAAIITPGSISLLVHSRSGSRGVGKLSEAGSSEDSIQKSEVRTSNPNLELRTASRHPP